MTTNTEIRYVTTGTDCGDVVFRQKEWEAHIDAFKNPARTELIKAARALLEDFLVCNGEEASLGLVSKAIETLKKAESLS